MLAAIAAERRCLDRHTHRRQSVPAATAPVAVLAAGLLSATSLTRDRVPEIPLEPVAVTADAGVGARADVVAHTWGGEITLVASGLADGRPYTSTRPSCARPPSRVVVLDAEGQQVLSAQL